MSQQVCYDPTFVADLDVLTLNTAAMGRANTWMLVANDSVARLTKRINAYQKLIDENPGSPQVPYWESKIREAVFERIYYAAVENFWASRVVAHQSIADSYTADYPPFPGGPAV